MAFARARVGVLLDRHEPLARTLGATTAIGLILGALIGGVGGRIAMRVLFLTSDERVRGVISDDGFEIGQVTLATLNLVAAGAFFGLIGAYVYLAVRPFLLGGTALRTVTCAAAAGAVIGAMIVNPSGVDFTVLSPVALAVALFVLIPAAFAGALVPVVEHALRPGGWARTAPTRVVVAPLWVFLFPPVLVVVGVPMAAVLGARWYTQRSPRARDIARHPAAMWLARAAWASVALFGAALLAEQIAALTTA